MTHMLTYNSVGVEHWNYFKYKMISQSYCIFVSRGYIVQEAWNMSHLVLVITMSHHLSSSMIRLFRLDELWQWSKPFSSSGHRIDFRFLTDSKLLKYEQDYRLMFCTEFSIWRGSTFSRLTSYQLGTFADLNRYMLNSRICIECYLYRYKDSRVLGKLCRPQTEIEL